MFWISELIPRRLVLCSCCSIFIVNASLFPTIRVCDNNHFKQQQNSFIWTVTIVRRDSNLVPSSIRSPRLSTRLFLRMTGNVPVTWYVVWCINCHSSLNQPIISRFHDFAGFPFYDRGCTPSPTTERKCRRLRLENTDIITAHRTAAVKQPFVVRKAQVRPGAIATS